MTVHIQRRVIANETDAYLTIAANGTQGYVLITTDTPHCADYFGPISLNLDYSFVRSLAYALYAAADEAADNLDM